MATISDPTLSSEFSQRVVKTLISALNGRPFGVVDPDWLEQFIHSMGRGWDELGVPHTGVDIEPRGDSSWIEGARKDMEEYFRTATKEQIQRDLRDAGYNG